MEKERFPMPLPEGPEAPEEGKEKREEVKIENTESFQKAIELGQYENAFSWLKGIRAKWDKYVNTLETKEPAEKPERDHEVISGRERELFGACRDAVKVEKDIKKMVAWAAIAVEIAEKSIHWENEKPRKTNLKKELAHFREQLGEDFFKRLDVEKHKSEE